MFYIIQGDRWMARYHVVKTFIEKNKRNPSKFISEERNLQNWARH